MKNIFLFSLTIFLGETICGQSIEKIPIKDFQNYPREFNSDKVNSLFKNIVTNDSLEYLVIYYCTDENRELVYENGDSKMYADSIQKIKCELGILQGCMPDFCFYNIITVKDKKIGLIKSNNELIKLIGRIDNLSEVSLVTFAKGYGFDENDKRGGAYFERNDDYLLYVAEFKDCPDTKISVPVILNKNGKWTELKKKVYYKNKKDCITP